MADILTKRLEHASAWKGSEIKQSDSWIYRLTDEEIKEIDAALQNVRMKGLSITDVKAEFTKEDFPLPNFKAKLNQFAEEISTGRGFLLVKGLPVEKYTVEESSIIFFALGLYMGIPISQNAQGHILGHVKSQGLSLKDTNVRGYQTTAYLPFHTDGADVVGLLCIQKAKSGGASTIVSSMAVYNEILEKHPEYIGLLYNDYFYDRRGEERPGEEPVYKRPIFSYYDGYLSCNYIRGYIESAQAKTNVKLSKVEVELLELIDSICQRSDMVIDMELDYGDMQFVNNYTVLHSRTQYEDYEEDHRKRHLLRLWLNLENERPLSPELAEHRGGIQAKVNV